MSPFDANWRAVNTDLTCVKATLADISDTELAALIHGHVRSPADHAGTTGVDRRKLVAGKHKSTTAMERNALRPKLA